MKGVLWLVLSLASTAMVYYLFIRSFEFEVGMTAPTTPGDAIETIRIWNRSLPGSTVTRVDSFRTLDQHIVWKGRAYTYSWHFSLVADSLTRIGIEISEPGKRLLNKLLVPFANPPIEQDAAEIARQFYSVLKTHLSITQVKIVGEAELDSSFCMCRSVNTIQIEKAQGMMENYSLLTTFADKFKLKLEGPPSVKVREWSHSDGRLKFDFCFPIARTDTLPATNALVYYQFGKRRVLKAEYRGNYITSDRAWYALIQYAHRHGYKIDGLPIEHFYNNPNLGLSEATWRAEVFLPISE